MNFKWLMALDLTLFRVHFISVKSFIRIHLVSTMNRSRDDDIDSDYDDVEEGDRDDEVSNDEMYARRGPLNDLSRIENPYNLGDRDIDRQYDRTPHVGRYDVDKWIDEMKALLLIRY
ncbi:hypothetical protein V8E54_000553 [Elaphomyces granulatus]